MIPLRPLAASAVVAARAGTWESRSCRTARFRADGRASCASSLTASYANDVRSLTSVLRCLSTASTRRRLAVSGSRTAAFGHACKDPGNILADLSRLPSTPASTAGVPDSGSARRAAEIDRVHFIAATHVSDQVACGAAAGVSAAFKVCAQHARSLSCDALLTPVQPLSPCRCSGRAGALQAGPPDRSYSHNDFMLLRRLIFLGAKCGRGFPHALHLVPGASAVVPLRACNTEQKTVIATPQAPIGGMLYLMELSTRWRIELTWRTFFSTSVTALALSELVRGCNRLHFCASVVNFLSVSAGSFDFTFEEPYSQLPVIVAFAAGMGAFGAAFVTLNAATVKLRNRWSHSRPLLLLEVCARAAASAQHLCAAAAAECCVSKAYLIAVIAAPQT